MINGNSKAILIFTRLLSGEELVDNLRYRNKLIKTFPDSKGGEMEGAGIYAACGNKIDWILVKGICDFADGNKLVNKQANQEIAIDSALSICTELFNSSSAFKELNILPIDTLNDESLNESLSINEVLFDYYDKSKDSYYIQRESDKKFNQVFKQYGVWVYGPSGCGKSNLIIRNLIKGGKEIIQVNLSPCIGQDIVTFFNEILYEVTSKIDGHFSQSPPQNFNDCCRALIDLLERNFSEKELIIFIEEIPISSEKNQKEFAEKIFSLIISKTFVRGLNKVKFVLSSINDPTIHISVTQNKIHQHLCFTGLDYWNSDDIILLIKMIQKEFKINLNPLIISELISISNGSPRFIKKFFRSIYTLSKIDESTLRFLLKETDRELNHLQNV